MPPPETEMKPATGSDPTIVQQLATFVTDLGYDDIDAAALASAKALILDQLSCQLIGSTMPWLDPARQLVALTAGVSGEATVVGTGRRYLAADAAFCNASFGQACEFDDSAHGSAGHIGTASVPVAMAMGERGRIGGKEFLVALVAGYEVMYRLMRSVKPHHNTRGFHSQSIGGPFAGAAIAGKMIGLDAGQMAHALAIAGSHACGPIEYDQSGGEVKRIHAGLAARGGIHSAFLAQFGLTGPATIIEGKRGFCQIFSTQSDASTITPGLGEIFNITNISFKMYPAVGGVHTPISATEAIMARHRFAAADIATIRVGIPEKALLHGAGIRQPTDVIGAQFSLAYSLALVLSGRGNFLENYMNADLWRDPGLVDLMSRVEAYAHPDAHGNEDHMAQVHVTLKDGAVFEATTPYLRGSPNNPASPDELEAKARRLATRVLSAPDFEILKDTINHLEEVPDISVLAQLIGCATEPNP